MNRFLNSREKQEICEEGHGRHSTELYQPCTAWIFFCTAERNGRFTKRFTGRKPWDKFLTEMRRNAERDSIEA